MIWPVPHCSRVITHSDCVGLLIVLRLALVQDYVCRQLILRREMAEVGRRSELAEERQAGDLAPPPPECFSWGSFVNTGNANPAASWNLFEQLHVWLMLCARTAVPTLLSSIIFFACDEQTWLLSALTSPRITPDYCQMSRMLFWNCRPLTMMTFTAKPCAMAIHRHTVDLGHARQLCLNLSITTADALAGKFCAETPTAQRITCFSKICPGKRISKLLFSNETFNAGQNDDVLCLA